MFEKVAIVGLGLLGGSIARELRRHDLASSIQGVSRSTATSDAALSLGVVDEVVDLPTAVSGASLVVLATPMQSMLPILKTIENLVSPNCVITDVGSVKSELYLQVKRHCPELLSQLVFAHPIAGGEQSGVTASRLDLFEAKHLIITHTDEVKSEFTVQVSAMWQEFGANVVSMGLQEHDAVFAKTSHLPHVVAYSLVNYLAEQKNHEQLFDLAAAGFYDFSRIASSNAEMWRDICMTNRAEVVTAIDGFISQVQELRESISSSDQNSVLNTFEMAKAARDAGLKRKQIN